MTRRYEVARLCDNSHQRIPSSVQYNTARFKLQSQISPRLPVAPPDISEIKWFVLGDCAVLDRRLVLRAICFGHITSASSGLDISSIITEHPAAVSPDVLLGQIDK